MSNEEDRFVELYPELHHYTGWEALKGIFTQNEIWATHYKHLNDLTEIVHMKEYLTTLIPRNRKERRSAKQEVESLYKKTFSQLVTPFIVSFSTHARDADSDRENGVSNQWLKSTSEDGTQIGGYGEHGYALVFDTRRLNDILNLEFETCCYTQTTYSNVVYNQGLDGFRAAFEPLIKESAWFIWDKSSSFNLGTHFPKDYTRAEDFINDFIKTTVSFKHPRWHQEREVRIVAHPKHPSELKYISDSDPDDIKALRHRRIKEIFYRDKGKPFIKLFEKLGTTLPIKRIIVSPDENQDGLWRQAVELVGDSVPVHRSQLRLPK